MWENLRLSIHNHCLSEHAAADNQSGNKQLLRAVEDVATHLERITELSREAMLQSLQVEQKRLLEAGEISSHAGAGAEGSGDD